ncbi:hypothetical protein CFRS1_v010446 [Colletotrichum fructicola]|nr:hypothetical protein CFRS1_v010446 [Colletotrichum fructicola]
MLPLVCKPPAARAVLVIISNYGPLSLRDFLLRPLRTEIYCPISTGEVHADLILVSTVNIGAIFAVANSSLYGEADEHNTTRKNGNQQMPTGRLFKVLVYLVTGYKWASKVTCLAVQLQPCV